MYTYIHGLCQLLHSEHMHTNVPQFALLWVRMRWDLCEPNELNSIAYKTYVYMYVHIIQKHGTTGTCILFSFKVWHVYQNNESLGIALTKIA